MKTAIIYLKLFLLTIVLCSCNYYQKPQDNDSQSKAILKLQATAFTGKFTGTFNNNQIAVDMSEKDNVVNGRFFLNNENFQLLAASNGSKFAGKITEEATGRFYEVSAEIKVSVLHLFITFPELNNQIVELQLQKESLSAKTTSMANNQKEKNSKLIGTWRYTEVLSSGYGGSYGSMATDYFVQFKPNGECISWTGSSAGGSGNVSYESDGNKNARIEQWYTEGKNLVLVNPQTNQKASVTFFAEENRIMLKGNKSRVYQRVR